jgi:hypothetical protein
MTFLDGKPAYGRLLRESILEVFEVEHARQVFERRYGPLADSQWAGIKAAIALIQAMEKQDPRHLQDYVKFQASAEFYAEEELVKSLSRVFKFPEAQEPLTAMLETVRGLKKKTWSEEWSKLKDRTAVGGRFAVVSELLRQLNRLVCKARFVMYFDRSQKKPLPAIYCPDAGTGLAAMIFNRVPTPRGLGVCRRPACHKSFPRMRPGQQYCSLRCGNADRKAHERARKSQK